VTYIHHVTTTTGHTRRSYRSEVDADLMPRLRELLDAALMGEADLPVPDPDRRARYRLRATAQGRCMVATAYLVYGAQQSKSRMRIPLVSFGVSGHSRCGAALWRSLHQGPCPPEPWCAVRIHDTIAIDPAAARWIGDLERCIAWAWLDRLETQS